MQKTNESLTQYEITSLVRDFSELPNTAWQVSVVVARYYNSSLGYSHIATATLVKKTGLNRDTVFEAIKLMRDSQEWEIESGGRVSANKNQANRYRPQIARFNHLKTVVKRTSWPSMEVPVGNTVLTQFEITKSVIDCSNLKKAALRVSWVVAGAYFPAIGYCYMSPAELGERCHLDRGTVRAALKTMVSSGEWTATLYDGQSYYYPNDVLVGSAIERVEASDYSEDDSEREEERLDGLFGFSPKPTAKELKDRAYTTIELIGDFLDLKTPHGRIAYDKMYAEGRSDTGMARLVKEFAAVETRTNRTGRPDDGDNASLSRFLADVTAKWIVANINNHSDQVVTTRFSTWVRVFCTDDPYAEKKKRFSTSAGLAKASTFSTSMATERIAREEVPDGECPF